MKFETGEPAGRTFTFRENTVKYTVLMFPFDMADFQGC
jgi:hypothetical protein